MSEPAPGPEAQPHDDADGHTDGHTDGRADGRADGDGPRRVVVTRRRAPKYRAFGLSGAVVGVAIGLAIGLLREPQGDYTTQAIAGYFATALGLIGALLGLGVALLTERRRR